MTKHRVGSFQGYTSRGLLAPLQNPPLQREGTVAPSKLKRTTLAPPSIPGGYVSGEWRPRSIAYLVGGHRVEGLVGLANVASELAESGLLGGRENI